MKFKILGRWWRLESVQRLADTKDYHIVGQADQTPGKPRVIKILGRLRGQDRLETTLHELLHASGWFIDEAFVEQFAVDAARVLWRLGWRNIDEVANNEKSKKGTATP